MTRTSVSAEGSLRTFSKEKTELLNLLLERRARQTQYIRTTPRNTAGSVLLPASWAQLRLWFIDQLEGGSAGYNNAIAVRLRGDLDQGVLERVLILW